MADWQTAIARRQADAGAHVLIYVNNTEHATETTHIDGSGIVRFDVNTGLYGVCNTADATAEPIGFGTNAGLYNRRENLNEDEVPYALEELGIVDSDWV